MKSKLLLGFLLYTAIPGVVVILLFKWNLWAGLLGILAWIALMAWVNRGFFYRIQGNKEYRKGDMTQTARWFEKAAKIKNAKPSLFVDYGFILLKLGKLEEAERIFLDAIKNSKTEDEKSLAKSNLALVIWKKGELDNAISMLTEVISKFKTSAVYGSLGYLLIEKGDLDEALQINQEAYEFNPDNAIILDNLAHLYHLRGEMEKAQEIFDKLLTKEPHFPEAFHDYGKFLEESGKLKEAAVMYRKSLSCPFTYNNTITKEQVWQCLDEVTEKIPGAAEVR